MSDVLRSAARSVAGFCCLLVCGSATWAAGAGIPPLPEPVASFGGTVQDGWLYVYSGHTGQEHEHSRDNLSQHFCRLQLDGGTAWEELPMGKPLQGLPLVAHDQYLYRVGGLDARNAPEEEDDLHSVDEFVQFDPRTKTWTALAPLPERRSSHDAVVIGDRLYVVGGWQLSGSDREGEWLKTAWVYDLTADEGTWGELPKPPFTRRALAAAHWQGKLVALCGMTEDQEVSRRVDFYDPATGRWEQGPDLPGDTMGGFGISAWNLDGRLYVSGLEGVVYRLAADGQSWQPAAELTQPRFFHRLLPAGSEKLLAVAGASAEDGHLADIEVVEVSGPEPTTSAAR